MPDEAPVMMATGEDIVVEHTQIEIKTVLEALYLRFELPFLIVSAIVRQLTVIRLYLEV